MVSLEPEDGTIEAFWEADRRVSNQHPLRCLLPIDIPPVSDMCKINVINKWKHRDTPWEQEHNYLSTKETESMKCIAIDKNS